MPIKLLMPALSPTMTEGNLVKWHKAVGDTIKAGQVLAEIETDKATMEVEAVDEGILGKILVLEGTENVQVNQVIALILEEGEDASSLDKVSFDAPVATSEPHPTVEKQDTSPSKPITAQTNSDQRIFITPLAKRIAQEKGINPSSIQGSGPGGRIVKEDVENATPSGQVAAPMRAGGHQDIKLNNIRKVVAKRLTESKQTVPHFYLSMDCQLDALLALRQQLSSKPGYKFSVNDFIIKACALALMEVPEANATWHDTYIRQYDYADISVAVAIDGGLITPVIRRAEAKTLQMISSEMKSLAEKARAGKLTPEEYQGGSFSLSNLGMFGVKHFGAIINPPQACIIAVGAGEQRAVVKDGQLTIATMMTATLSVDHRAVDGAGGAKYLGAFKNLIEHPVHLVI